ncbi:hypothetical protein LTR56_008426 [Elasticomyces elasticus]|nr:hypothetical protein LTR22_016765 [Elasticomyces elasticus]KAK3646662.1 hypothetical protein LTR56_008426 [Elasticomyces elasticus]KAK4913762.1 hypothetical protein LTR49_017910 [Elasticomyces elasticus]KAK5757973.1 hypothetical protein LTS12_011868 [Elasticomyces elasticus]
MFMYWSFFRKTADTLRKKDLFGEASYVDERMEELFDESMYLAEQSSIPIRRRSNKASKGKDKGGK